MWKVVNVKTNYIITWFNNYYNAKMFLDVFIENNPELINIVEIQ